LNDDFADRFRLSGLPLSVEATNRFTTHEPGEPAHGAGHLGGSVWWRWTAPRKATVTVVALGCWVAVYVGGSLEGLSQLANGYYGATFQCEEGVEYSLAVEGFGSLSTLELVLPPPNDDFVNRAGIPSAPAEVPATFLGATAEPDEPALTTSSPRRTIWWSWTAPASGRVVLQVAGLQSSVALGVYRGSTLPALTPVATNAFGGGGRLVFTALSGTTYYLCAAMSGFAGEFVLYLSAPSAPARIDSASFKKPTLGPAEFRVVGARWDEFVIQASTDLSEWAPLTTGMLEDDAFSHVDPAAAWLPWRFYRVRPWP
jgi:hypothetical protein